MHTETTLLTFISLLAIASATHPATQSKRQDFSHQDVNPKDVCGDMFVNCNNGWCCPSGETCSNNFEGVDGIPTCEEGDYKEEPAKPYNFAAASSFQALAQTKLPAEEASNIMTSIDNAAEKESSSAAVAGRVAVPDLEAVVIWACAAVAGFGLVLGRM